MKQMTISFIALLALAPACWSQSPIPDKEEFEQRSQRWTEGMHQRGLSDPFVGITPDGNVQPDLFHIRPTGVSTAPIVEAANTFLGTLNSEEKDRVMFAHDDIEWRQWANPHIYFRQGLDFETMSADQREGAFGLIRASLSAEGFELSRDIMRLNHTLGELNNNNFVEYGEWKYSLSIMGEPSTTEPWGWQLDGHHLNLNYFVLGDQVVFTPAFWGSEPAVATSGKFKGTAIMQTEQVLGLELIRSLNDSQRQQAVIATTKPGNNIVAQMFSDNVVLDYTGIPISEFDTAQQQKLLNLIDVYVSKQRDAHQDVWMQDIKHHLDRTFFAWVGGMSDDDVFYYRIHSPVILIEFDHETPVGLRHRYPPGVPYKEHIHAVVRTPNGNDYGKDLLRQHHLQHKH